MTPEEHKASQSVGSTFPMGMGSGFRLRLCLSMKPPDSSWSDKICMCHNLDQDPHPLQNPPGTLRPACLLWQSQPKSVKADMTCCYECDNIKQLLKKSIKVLFAARRGIAFRDHGAILPGATGTLLLSQRELMTAEATESKHAIISQKPHTVAF